MIPFLSYFSKVKHHSVWYIQPEGLPYSYITVGTRRSHSDRASTGRFHAFSGNLYLGSYYYAETAARAVVVHLRTIDIEGETYTLDFLLGAMAYNKNK